MQDIVIGDWSKLGSTIKAQRQRLGLSQVTAAERANVSRSWLAKVETGHRGAELEQVLRLLHALGMTMIVRTSVSPAEADQEVTHTIRGRRRERSANRRQAWSAGAVGVEPRHG